MLGLSLPENRLDNYFHFRRVNFEIRIFNVARFILSFAITKHETTQLKFLLFIVVWSNLVKPKSDFLVIVFLWSRLFQVLNSLEFQLRYQFVFCLKPGGITLAFIVIAILMAPIIVFVLAHLWTHTFALASTITVLRLLKPRLRVCIVSSLSIFILALVFIIVTTFAKFGIEIWNRF